MTYYSADGSPAFEEPLFPKPGIMVTLFDSQMHQVTGWSPISIQWMAKFGVIDKDTNVYYCVLWDGQDGMRRWPIDVPRNIIKGDHLELDFWDRS